jgi:hypothetical protein
MVHVVPAPLARLDAPQESADNSAAVGLTETRALFLTESACAVRIPHPENARLIVAVNVALDDPAGTLTDAGITSPMVFPESATLTGSAEFASVTVHSAMPPEMGLDGLHVRELRPGEACSRDTAAPSPPTGAAAASPIAPRTPAIPTGGAAAADGEVVISAMATTPSGMVLAFKPAARQVYAPEPGPAAQESVFPAAVKAGPALIEMEAMELAG